MYQTAPEWSMYSQCLFFSMPTITISTNVYPCLLFCCPEYHFPLLSIYSVQPGKEQRSPGRNGKSRLLRLPLLTALSASQFCVSLKKALRSFRPPLAVLLTSLAPSSLSVDLFRLSCSVSSPPPAALAPCHVVVADHDGASAGSSSSELRAR